MTIQKSGYLVPSVCLGDLLRPEAQHVLPDLARGHARQVVDQHDVLGEFLTGEAGGISPFQHARGRELAEAEGAEYDSFGATPVAL
jgi:hypothetical protein